MGDWTLDENFNIIGDVPIPMMCRVYVEDPNAKVSWTYGETVKTKLAEDLKLFQSILEFGWLFVTITVLVVYTIIITMVILRSLAMKRQYTEEKNNSVEKNIKISSGVTLVAVVLVLVSVLPTLVVDFIKKYRGSVPNQKLQLALYLMIFVGPIFNPWLYPIRMASMSSARSHKKSIVSSFEHVAVEVTKEDK